jgi:hypothetical protein
MGSNERSGQHACVLELRRLAHSSPNNYDRIVTLRAWEREEKGNKFWHYELVEIS